MYLFSKSDLDLFWLDLLLKGMPNAHMLVEQRLRSIENRLGKWMHDHKVIPKASIFRSFMYTSFDNKTPV